MNSIHLPQRNNKDYAIVNIKWLDTKESEGPYIIALKDTIEGISDDEIFYYCKSMEELESLRNESGEDFIITEILEVV